MLFGLFVGQLVFAAIYMVLAALFGHLGIAYIICFCVGMLFIAIASTLMYDHNGIARIVIFLIGMLLLVIPSGVLNIIVIINKTGSLIELSFFAACVGLVMLTWLVCGYTDTHYYMLNILPVIGIIILAAIIKAILKSVFITSIIFLVIGGIALIVMLIIRICGGSALSD